MNVIGVSLRYFLKKSKKSNSYEFSRWQYVAVKSGSSILNQNWFCFWPKICICFLHLIIHSYEELKSGRNQGIIFCKRIHRSLLMHPCNHSVPNLQFWAELSKCDTILCYGYWTKISKGNCNMISIKYFHLGIKIRSLHVCVPSARSSKLIWTLKQVVPQSCSSVDWFFIYLFFGVCWWVSSLCTIITVRDSWLSSFICLLSPSSLSL